MYAFDTERAFSDIKCKKSKGRLPALCYYLLLAYSLYPKPEKLSMTRNQQL